MSIKKNQQGFTMVELIIVIIILGVLAAGTKPLWGAKDEAPNDKLINDQVTAWISGAERYASANNGSFAGMSNSVLVDDLGMVEPEYETNHTGAANTISVPGGNNRQLALTMEGVSSQTANRAIESYDDLEKFAVEYTGGNLVFTYTK